MVRQEFSVEEKGTKTRSPYQKHFSLFLVWVSDRNLCVCVCSHADMSSFYLCVSLIETSLCTVILTSDRSNFNWFISLVVPQLPALPGVTG